METRRLAMTKIDKLQQAIYSNLDTLQKLYEQAEGLHGLIDKVDDESLKGELTKNYEQVIDTLSRHMDTTDGLIKALKQALND